MSWVDDFDNSSIDTAKFGTDTNGTCTISEGSAYLTINEGGADADAGMVYLKTQPNNSGTEMYLHKVSASNLSSGEYGILLGTCQNASAPSCAALATFEATERTRIRQDSDGTIHAEYHNAGDTWTELFNHSGTVGAYYICTLEVKDSKFRLGLREGAGCREINQSAWTNLSSLKADYDSMWVFWGEPYEDDYYADFESDYFRFGNDTQIIAYYNGTSWAADNPYKVGKAITYNKGLDFIRDHGVVVDLGAAYSWDSANVKDPYVVTQEDTTYMVYAGHDNGRYELGLATAPTSDPDTFTKDAGNPIISPPASTVFIDDCERFDTPANGGWTTSQTAPTYSTTYKFGRGHSLRLYDASVNPDVEHTFSTLTSGRVKGKFYDSGGGTRLFLGLKNGATWEGIVAINTATSATHYASYNGSSWAAGSVARSNGWHSVEFDFGLNVIGSNVIAAKIDGTTLFSGASFTQVDRFSLYTAAGESVYYDNFFVSNSTTEVWNEWAVRFPVLIYDPADVASKRWKMYVGGDIWWQNRFRIGYYYAATPDAAWTEGANNPILAEGADWDNMGCYPFDFILDGSTKTLFYGGVNTSTSRWQAGVSTSADWDDNFSNDAAPIVARDTAETQALTANLSVGSSTVTVTSTTNFTAGEPIQVSDSLENSTNKSMVNRIKSMTSTVITFWYPNTIRAFNTANTATVRSYEYGSIVPGETQKEGSTWKMWATPFQMFSGLGADPLLETTSYYEGSAVDTWVYQPLKSPPLPMGKVGAWDERSSENLRFKDFRLYGQPFGGLFDGLFDGKVA